jgi:putative transcriptional regulator
MKKFPKTPRARVSSSRTRGTAAGREILEALTELADSLGRGERESERFTVRTVERPANPLPYDGPAVRATRDLVGASQSLFAALLGVSTVLVQHWEAGQRTPAAWACRLLDEVNRDPNHWRGMLARPAGSGRTAG